MSNCRSCGSPTIPILSLGEMPLANRLLDYPGEPFSTYPLDLDFCESCKLGQLRELVQPEEMFSDYPYYASASEPNVQSARALVDMMVEMKDLRSLSKDAFVCEIGSNDGYLLYGYKCHGIRCLGIDPASGPANAAALKGIPIVQAYFGLRLAETLPKADVIHAHNVLAHVPDLNDFVAGIEAMLKPNGVVVVEVPYLGTLIEKCSFDLIYHEHAYYFSIQAAAKLFRRHGMGLMQLERISSQGGSLRLFFSKATFARTLGEIPEENFDLKGGNARVLQYATAFRNFILQARCKDKTVWGFGASAKATIMMNVSKVDKSLIPFIADSTLAKLGKYIPGTDTKIVHPQDWLDAAPDYTCIFAWNYAQEIAHRYREDYKGKFFTPYILPTESK